MLLLMSLSSAKVEPSLCFPLSEESQMLEILQWKKTTGFGLVIVQFPSWFLVSGTDC